MNPAVPRAQQLGDCDRDIRAFVLDAARTLRTTLGGPLVGTWLHGSLATGSYYRPKSDIDLLAVVAEPIDALLRAALEQALLEVSDQRPTTGDLELSILLESNARNFVHPLPYEFHFGDNLKPRIRAGDAQATGPGIDPDLAAHCTSVRLHGIAIEGPPPVNVFGPVPRADFLAAIRSDLEWILANDHILESPFYGVLNACRVLRILEQDEEGPLDTTKEQGASWGLEVFPTAHRPLVRRALEVLRSNEDVTESERQRGGREWDKAALHAFREYAAARLEEASKPKPESAELTD